MADAKIVLSAQDKTAAAFRSLNKSLQDSDALVGRFSGALIGLTAAALAPAAIYAVFDRLVKGAGDFQDMAEKAGDSAEAFASLNVAAGTTGKTMDDVIQASIKLTKNLTGVDDESTDAGAAIKALGLDMDKFKRLSPVDQIEAIAKALAGFADGPGKTAAAVALFGKSGAELLPFMKELAGETGRQNILSAQQIKLADEYADKQARARTQLTLYAQALATDALPAYTAVTNAAGDLIKQIVGVGEGTNSLRNSTAILDWAESAALAIGTVVEAAVGAIKGLSALAGSVESVAADARFLEALTPQGAAQALARGETPWSLLEKRNQKAHEANQRYVELWKYDGTAITTAIRKSFADQRRLLDPENARESRRFGSQAAQILGAGELDSKGKGKGKDAAQLAKAQRDFDIEALKNAAEELVGTYSNAEKIMEAMRAAGLLDEAEYYQAKRDFLTLDAKAKEDALQQEIARYQQENLTGKDKLENDKKIAAAQAELAKLRGKTAADLAVLGIQETAAIKRVAKAYEEARIAAELYLAVSGKQYQRELAAFGRGDGARDKAAASSQIDDRYQGQRDELERDKRLLEMLSPEGKLTGEARKQYETRLEIINEFNAKALDQWERYYADLLAKQGNWENGATRALENYLESTGKVAEQTEQLFTKAFQGMEDALVDFVKTGKLDFKSLVNSIIADLARIVIRQQITGPLAGWMNGLLSGGGSVNAAGGSAGAGFGTGAGYGNQDFGGFFAKGGTLQPGQWGIAGENGPEPIFAGARPLHVTPNGGGASVINITINAAVGNIASKSDVVDGMRTVANQIVGKLQRRDTYGKGS